MDIKYSEIAVKQLKKIARGDKKSAALIVKAIEAYGENPREKFDVKVLRGELGDFKRLRAGNYRIIFDDEGNIMLIYEIKHRQEAYHD